jgi:hypothetical protein
VKPSAFEYHVRSSADEADALAPLGVTIRRQPLSPSEIVSLIGAVR